MVHGTESFVLLITATKSKDGNSVATISGNGDRYIEGSCSGNVGITGQLRPAMP